MSVDSLCDTFNHSVSIEWKPREHFINDVKIIIQEIVNFCQANKIEKLNIYEICVSCGSSLTWDYCYNITQQELHWFKYDGRKHFLHEIARHINIDSLTDYSLMINAHNKLSELFELQLE